MDGDAVLARIDADDVIKFAQELVRLPSPVGEERALGVFLAARLASMGLVVTTRDVHEGRLNVLAVLPGKRSDSIGLLFHGHMDTIPFLGMNDPLSGEVQQGHIWGRGSVDQKGGLAAAIMALQALKDSGMSLAKGVGIAAVVDEESEHRGSFALVDDGLQAEFAVVTEPSDLRLIAGCKGTVPARITVHGRQAHGSTPWLGINAIEHAARVVEALGRAQTRSVDVPGVGRIEGSTNVGLIQGGTAYNNVPDRCELWLDRRTVPGESQTMALSEIQAILDDLAAADPEFRGEVSIDRPDWRWPRIRERGLNPAATLGDNQLNDALREAHRRVTGQAAELGYSNGYLDMDFLINDLGIPTLNYGPGQDALCHTDEERLSIDHLLAAVQVYALTALALCGVAGDEHLWRE